MSRAEEIRKRLKEINKEQRNLDKKIEKQEEDGNFDSSLYDYLIDAGYNQKYKIICSTNDYKMYNKDLPSNVIFVSNIRGVLQYFSAGFVYYCFGKIPIFHGKDQKVVQMWHGSAFKAPDEGMLKGHSFEKPYYTNVFSSSKHFAPIFS